MQTPKPIALLGQTGDFPGSPLDPLKAIFQRTGLNTGNIAFFHAVKTHIGNRFEIVPWFFNPEEINERFSSLLMPAANMINSFQDHGQLADIFAKLKVPVAIVGLGTQLPLGADPETLILPEGTTRLLKVLSQIGAFVGCRGEVTFKVLKRYGVDPVIMGCPSNFTNARTDLGRHIEGLYGDPIRGILAHCDFSRKLSEMNGKIVGWIEAHGGMISIQDPERGFRVAARDSELLNDDGALKDIAEIFRIDRNAARAFAVNKFIVFADWSAWSFYSRSFSLSLGTRMHGNMIAFQAEVPTILFPHDARVDELVSTMRLPQVPLEAAVKAESIQQLLDQVKFDGTTYDRQRGALAAAYFGILRSIGIEVAPAFSALSSADPRSEQALSIQIADKSAGLTAS